MPKKPKPLFTGPWYPWYVDAVGESERVGEMSLAVEAAYRRALDYQWKKGSVPNDPERLANIVKKKCTPKMAAVVLTMFVAMPDDPTRAQNPTLEKTRAEQEGFHNKKVRDGRKGALKRWGKTTYIDSSAISTPIAKNSKRKVNIKETKRKEEEENSSAVVGSSDSSPQEKNAAPTKRGTRIPEPFYLTAKMRAWAEKNCPSIDSKTETEKFVNHFRAKTGKDATSLDWEARWRNWMLNARDRYGENRNGNRGQNGRTSEREKSAERGANAEEFADTLDELAKSRGAQISGDDGSSGTEIHQLGEQPFVN